LTVTLINSLNIAQIVLSVALIGAIILQSKEAGLGGLTGADTGGVFRARRGLERTLFNITIGLAVAFFLVAIVTLMVGQVGQ
jgi:preprotein translocase subunit SecG